MTNIKEFRDWFFRKAHKTVGFKPDQEQGFPLQIVVGDCKVGQRLNDGEYPSEAMFRKLLSSILMSLEAEDRAKDSDSPNYTQNGNVLGGHVTVATDPQARGTENDLGDPVSPATGIGVNGNENLYTRVPRVSQLPTVEERPNLSDVTFAIEVLNDTMPDNGIDIAIDNSVSTRTHYLVRLSNEFIDWFRIMIAEVKAYIDTVDIEGSSVTYNGSNTVSVGLDPADATRTNKFTVFADLKYSNSTVSDVVTLGSSPNTVSTLAVSIPTSPAGKKWKLTGVLDWGSQTGGTAGNTADTTGTFCRNVLTFRFFNTVTNVTYWARSVEVSYSNPASPVENRHANVVCIVDSVTGTTNQVALQVTNQFGIYQYTLHGAQATLIVEEL